MVELLEVLHDAEGLVFEKQVHFDTINYVVVIGDRGQSADERKRTLLIEGIAKGRFSKEVSNLLVRHGVPPACGYYPVSLVFASKADRIAAAVKSHKEPPTEYWIQRMQREVMVALKLR